jgi:asparagine synthase (glutamine-hydrolysing)
MCGICGYFKFSEPTEERSLLEAMTATLKHRGPDGSGLWVAANARVGLGHNRLSIIDLASGAQPMLSADGRFVIVFNGEIYNFRALRKELEAWGHAFSTSSDTEVILESYRRWGRRCVERLHGMFAFALYDSHECRLVLARDRTGVKPLYYHLGPAGFFFGSEIKAILALPAVPRRVNYLALIDFLRLGYPLIPATLFSDIQELEPGTWLELSPGGMQRGGFWSWKRSEARWREDEALEHSEQALIESLKENLVADVAVGAFLSGGIDSSLLAALLVRKLGVRLDTFHVRFAEARYDESPYARAVANHLGTRHHEIDVDQFDGDSALELVDRILSQFDQPFLDSSAVPTFLICREIRKFVKVALSGDGGDEMFGGYPDFWYADLAQRLGAMPQWSLRALAHFSATLRHVAQDRFREAQRLLAAASEPNGDRLLALYSHANRDELSRMVHSFVLNRVGDYQPGFCLNGHGAGPGGADLIDSIIRFMLPGDYLRKVDVMSSAHGLEVRVPFLGEGVLECAAQLPNSLKYRGRTNKTLLRKLAARYLPRAVVEKPKWGFGIPLDSWLGRSGREAVRGMLGSPKARIRALIRPEYISGLLDSFVSQRWDHSRLSRFGVYQRVYALWSLERWLGCWNPSL